MDAQIVEATLKFHIAKLPKQIETGCECCQGRGICAEAGNVSKAVEDRARCRAADL